jgi:hypothetical protein
MVHSHRQALPRRSFAEEIRLRRALISGSEGQPSMAQVGTGQE